MLKPSDIEHFFSYHPPRPDQIARYYAIREAAKAFALVVLENTPGSPDQTVAIRHIRDAVAAANASIALEPAPVEAQQGNA